MKQKTFRYAWHHTVALQNLASTALVLFVILGMALSGCGVAPTEAPSSSESPESNAINELAGEYTTKQVPIFRKELTDEQATLRFYDDMPNVAYINVADFYQILMPQGTMDVNMQEDGTWLLTSHTGADPTTAMEFGTGGTAVVDPAAGTISSPNLAAFANSMSLTQDGMDNVYIDGIGVMRVGSVEYNKPAETVTIDLAKYGIVARGDDDGVWLPVHTLTTFFTNLRYDYVMYNGEKLYVDNENDMRPLAERDPGFGDAFFAQDERPDDAIAFDYAQFCFVFDNFYGKPAHASEVLNTQGLDAYLQSLGEDGKAIKNALLSKDYAMYLHGCDGLHSVLNVDEHTVIDVIGSSGLSKSEAHKDLYERYKALGEDADDPINKLIAKRKASILQEDAIQLSCKKLSHKAFGDNTYVKKGDTAVIVLDSFNGIDTQGWKDFYAGKGKRPSGSKIIDDETSPYKGSVDSIGIFLDGLEKAKADPEVKNVIVDVSKNDGGSDDVVIFATSLMAKREHERFVNLLTGQTITERFDVDSNLDGKFNEKDALVDNSDLHFAVLTSGFSFSCASLFPSILKDAGIPIIGEQSRGGSCSVQKQVTGSGLVYTHSSWLSRIMNDAGEDIDKGVPVDVDLLKRAGSTKELREVEFEGKHLEAEVHDYSSFFDMDNLSQVMNEIYGTDREGNEG